MHPSLIDQHRTEVDVNPDHGLFSSLRQWFYKFLENMLKSSEISGFDGSEMLVILPQHYMASQHGRT
jgi:hypothetical protein